MAGARTDLTAALALPVHTDRAHTDVQAPAVLCRPHLAPSLSALQGVNPAVPRASLGNDILLNKQTGAIPVDL